MTGVRESRPWLWLISQIYHVFSQRQFLITQLFYIIINLLNAAADAASLKQLNNLWTWIEHIWIRGLKIPTEAKDFFCPFLAFQPYHECEVMDIFLPMNVNEE